MELASEVSQPAQVYVVHPCSQAEASHGKACLLTDTMIAQLLDLLKLAEATTEIGKEAVDGLWQKFLDLWVQEGA